MFSTSTFIMMALAAASTSLAQNFNCILTVPPNPLSAKGLATPYEMTGCDQTQFSTQGCFVEAAILDPATGAVQIYNPLVINKNKAVAGKDFITPVVPTLPANAVVGIWFGSNAQTLTLNGATNGCVNGDGKSIFGQFAYCNAPEFFTAAETAVSKGLLTVPPPGSTTKAATVQPCPVTRDFRIVDMDQSDNVDTTYLLINGTVLAQNTPANNKANPNAVELSNGSDNALVNDFLDPTLGCTSFTAPSITSPNGISASLALNELQSQQFPPAGGPALVPLNDDFTVINGANGNVEQSLVKTNLYRAGVGQPQANDLANASGVTYCIQYAQSGLFIASNEKLFSGATSPAPDVANNLFTFLANRFATSFGPVPSLGCTTILGVDSPVNQTTDANGVVVAASINTKVLQDILDGVIQPVNSSTTSKASANSAASAASVASSTSAASVASVASTSTSSQAVAASSASSLSLSATSTSISTTSTTTVVVEVVSFFVFLLSLGGITPGVTSNGASGFLVLEEEFIDLPSAASAACTHQFNTCASLAGSEFSGTDCLSQLNNCKGVATTASPTASTPATIKATVTVPTSAVQSAVVAASSAGAVVLTGSKSAGLAVSTAAKSAGAAVSTGAKSTGAAVSTGAGSIGAAVPTGVAHAVAQDQPAVACGAAEPAAVTTSTQSHQPSTTSALPSHRHMRGRAIKASSIAHW